MTTQAPRLFLGSSAFRLSSRSPWSVPGSGWRSSGSTLTPVPTRHSLPGSNGGKRTPRAFRRATACKSRALRGSSPWVRRTVGAEREEATAALQPAMRDGASWQPQAASCSLDHLVSPDEEGGGKLQSERGRGFEIERELEMGCAFDRQLAGRYASQDLDHICRCAPQ